MDDDRKLEIDLNANELIGSDYKLTFNKSTFGNTENDPRIYGRYLNSDKNTTSMKKSTFTTETPLKESRNYSSYQIFGAA